MAQSATMRARLDAALDHILLRLRQDATPAEVIGELVAGHRATHDCRASTNTLRVAGVSATCTWSRDEGLLTAWRNAAMRRIMSEPTS